MAATSGKPSPQPRPQYHHFIPRFILRNYAEPLPALGQATSKRKKKIAQQQARDGMLNVIDLEKVKVTQAPLSRSFGLLDMYRDTNSSNQFMLEEKLAKLEGHAAKILGGVKKRYDEGLPNVWLTRAERDTLRKFLFIMKYRSRLFYERFVPETGEYVADDKEAVLQYMKEKGFERPIDVWFHNICAFLDLVMDAEKKWMATILKQAYPPDATWFIANIQAAYLVFCQTSGEGDEYLLTGNAYSIFEGPVSRTFDEAEQSFVDNAYTEYHCFAPVSSKLMMVLRSFLMPSGVGEGGEDCRERMLEENKRMHNNYATAGSILQDLPASKASTIVFKSKIAARNMIEAYLTEASDGLKHVTDLPTDGMGTYLGNLERIVQQLGGSAKSNHHVLPMPRPGEDGFDTLSRALSANLPAIDTEFLLLYKKLDGHPEQLLRDLDQAKRMLNLVIKVDVAIQRLSNQEKEKVRFNRQELLITLPVRRVWLFLKYIRNIDKLDEPEMDGPEDIIANAARQFRADALTRQMYQVSRTQDFLARHPDIGLAKMPTSEAELLRRVREERHFVFERIGSIRNCGIPKIEAVANTLYDQARQLKVHEAPNRPFLCSGEDYLELAVRNNTKDYFHQTLAGDLEPGLLQNLEKVMFGILYKPVFGK